MRVRDLASVAVILLVAAKGAALATEVELTLKFRLANGTQAIQTTLAGPVVFSTTGVAPVQVSGGPSDPVLHFASGVALSNPELTSLLPTPFGVVLLPDSAFFGTLPDPQIGPGQLSLAGLSLGTGAAGGGLPIVGRLGFAQLTSISPAGGPMTINGTGVGLGGSTLFYEGGPGGAVRLSVMGAPWTAGAASLLSRTTNGALQTFVRSGFAHGPTSGTSGVLSPGGVIRIVTPIQIQTRFLELPVHTWGIFGELTLRFIPEPGVGMMLAAGAVALILLGRHRFR